MQGSYLNNSTTSHQAPVSGTIELSAMVNRQNPNNLWVTSYRGVLGGTTLATVQVSGRHFGARNAGGTETDILELAVPHARRVGRSGRPLLRRAVPRLDRPGGPQQPAGHGLAELVADLGAAPAPTT